MDTLSVCLWSEYFFSSIQEISVNLFFSGHLDETKVNHFLSHNVVQNNVVQNDEYQIVVDDG